MNTGISINKHVYSILINDEELKKMVGNNIFPLVAENSATFPFLIFKRNNISTEYTKDGRLFDIVEFTILVVGNTYEDTINISERVRTLMEFKNNQYFQDTRITSINEDYVDDSYVQEISFSTIIK